MNDPRETLVRHARAFYERGWMAGTSGNLSLRDGDDILITASGRAKGELTPDDILCVPMALHVATTAEMSLAGTPRPSAELAIHRAIYELYPGARAVYHVHTVEANWLTANDAREIELPALEMLKGFGIADESARMTAPIFENHADVERIARDVRRRFAAAPPDLPALLIRRHGLTTWAESADAARNQVELFEYILRYLALQNRAR
ncbi:methylthioribulose 1-phosphate dehydratase [bacterium]|nr:methylthioribulose 1-phosphate dehydratase [bacterium]